MAGTICITDERTGNLQQQSRKRLHRNWIRSKETFRWFLREESGQDLIEYSLLLAFIAMSCAAVVLGVSDSVQNIQNSTNSTLDQANNKIT